MHLRGRRGEAPAESAAAAGSGGNNRRRREPGWRPLGPRRTLGRILRLSKLLGGATAVHKPTLGCSSGGRAAAWGTSGAGRLTSRCTIEMPMLRTAPSALQPPGRPCQPTERLMVRPDKLIKRRRGAADQRQCQGDPACKQHVLLPACRPLLPLPPPPMHPLERQQTAASRGCCCSRTCFHHSNIISKHKLVGGLVTLAAALCLLL